MTSRRCTVFETMGRKAGAWFRRLVHGRPRQMNVDPTTCHTADDVAEAITVYDELAHSADDWKAREAIQSLEGDKRAHLARLAETCPSGEGPSADGAVRDEGSHLGDMPSDEALEEAVRTEERLWAAYVRASLEAANEDGKRLAAELAREQNVSVHRLKELAAGWGVRRPGATDANRGPTADAQR